MRGENSTWGVIAAGVGFVVAAGVAAVVLSSGGDDTSRVNTVDTSVGAPLAVPLDPVRVTVATTALPVTTAAVATTLAPIETTTTLPPPTLDTTPPPPPPAQLAAAGTSLDLGANGSAGTIDI